MSSYRIALTASAEKEMYGLPSKVVARIVPRLEHLAVAPRPPGCKKLKGGDNEWRIRVGDYRIVYEVDDAAMTVDVTRIASARGLQVIARTPSDCAAASHLPAPRSAQR